jgi:uncharacterized protein YciI
MTELKHHIYIFEAVRPELVTDPDAWTDVDIRIAEAHFEYLERATQSGTVILAGRATDGVGPAIVILDIANEDQARQFMQDDPFIAGGLMRAQLHPFRAALVRQNP